MAFIEGGYFGQSGRDATHILTAAIGIAGNMADYAWKKTETTREFVEYMLRSRLRKTTRRLTTNYVRPVRRWLS